MKQTTNKPGKGEPWDIAKLENKLAEMFASVREHCSCKETECAGEILGYWACEIQNCRNKESGK